MNTEQAMKNFGIKLPSLEIKYDAYSDVDYIVLTYGSNSLIATKRETNKWFISYNNHYKGIVVSVDDDRVEELLKKYMNLILAAQKAHFEELTK